ncbi:glycosyltransferase family 4 protein [uncultured Polaribacter sp.]|uniref:MraY family glycosyltransferase n=1 Tax=uncultured Polaribacter sp. TaxID=174711 RepID=UPI00262C9046|nr:glycosyltransferase family 4 protein [uncultured Polaribacter sp.]
MNSYIIVLLFLILASFIYLKLAIKFKIIDKPNERSSHKKITVRGGGIIFTIAILLFSVLNDFAYPYFSIGVFLISIVSFLDDIYTLSSKIRFPFQVLSACLLLLEVSLSFDFNYIIFLIIGVGIVNFFNFMDGINGITGLYSISVLIGFYLINLNESIVNADLIIYALISLIVFGFYNFRRKALFFAGDIGSISIGVLIFFLGMLFYIKLSSPLILLLIIVYGADAAFTLLYRKFYTRESVFEPHRHHIYQKLVHICKISHLKVSMLYAIIQLTINFIIYKSYLLDLKYQLIIFFGLIIFFTLLYIFIFQKIKKTIA